MSQLRIIQWNCFHFRSRVEEFRCFLAAENPDINNLHRFEGYVAKCQPREKRPEHGGGVAILVRENLQFAFDTSFDRYGQELLAMKLYVCGKEILFVTLYNPPRTVLTAEIFVEIESRKTEWIVMGDLNSKLVSLGGPSDEDLGLEDILLNGSGIVVNNRVPTYCKFQTVSSTSVLDLCICSVGCERLLSSFEVLTDQEVVHSDHHPIRAIFDLIPSRQGPCPKNKKFFSFTKADWNSFKVELPTMPDDDTVGDVEKLALYITNGIKKAADKSIPKFECRPASRPLPPEILVLLRERALAKKKWSTSKRIVIFDDNTDYKSLYNASSAKVKIAIKSHRNKVWTDFLAKVGKNFISSRPAWQKVNSFRGSLESKKIPCLFKDGVRCANDAEKAETFKEILEKRFAGSVDQRFDLGFKASVEAEVENYNQNPTAQISDFVPITMQELIANVKEIRGRSAPGSDGIYNKMLKNLSPEFLKLVLRLFNLCLEKGKMPVVWKSSTITMIPKGSKTASDPNNYRPISLISCLSKLLEKIVSKRLSHFLEESGWFAPQQSGFRRARRTTDNLVYHTQKVLEAFNVDKKVLSFSFDIQAAFDAVWHHGLVFKMQKAGVPRYMVNWTRAFLSDRTFSVRVNDSISALAPIITGVPRGSSVSPILFSMFINDIPMSVEKHKSYSLLFADDLTVSFIFKSVKLKDEEVSSRVRAFLFEIERWLCKWRMKMAPSKCNYTVFAKGNSSKPKFSFRLFDGVIPLERQPVSLGITFDECLNLKAQVKSLKAKCSQRLNIIKILSHKSWRLHRTTLVALYSSLIGTVIDYSAFLAVGLSRDLKKTLQAVQNNAVRKIFHLSLREHTSTERLCELSGLGLVETRMDELNARYFEKALTTENELIVGLADDYAEAGRRTNLDIKTPLCCFPDLFRVVSQA